MQRIDDVEEIAERKVAILPELRVTLGGRRARGGGRHEGGFDRHAGPVATFVPGKCRGNVRAGGRSRQEMPGNYSRWPLRDALVLRYRSLWPLAGMTCGTRSATVMPQRSSAETFSGLLVR